MNNFLNNGARFNTVKSKLLQIGDIIRTANTVLLSRLLNLTRFLVINHIIAVNIG
jgi:hypothetical protein